ncbi:hypothetical protein FQA39_LY13031 [Lamprigera yunnana]|nr:hypothetical protein FQA39_LY13031 [Lamprigera yunnana]
MKILNDLLGYESRVLYQDSEMFNFTLDSVLVARFANLANKRKNIVDFGTNNGVIPLIISKYTRAKITGVEIQPKAVELAKENIALNKLEDQIDIVCEDIKEFAKNNQNQFDIVIFSEEIANARHELLITLRDIIKSGALVLKNGGIFTIVHRAERTAEIIELFKEFKIVAKRIQFVHSKKDQPAKTVLIDGILEGNKYEIDNVIIGHNQNDLVETYLIQKQRKNIVDHYGLQDTSKYKELTILRPMLNLKRSEIINTNDDEKYLRNRIRKTLIEDDFAKYLIEIEKQNSDLKSNRSKALEIFNKNKNLLTKETRLLSDEVLKHYGTVNVLTISELNTLHDNGDVMDVRVYYNVFNTVIIEGYQINTDGITKFIVYTTQDAVADIKMNKGNTNSCLYWIYNGSNYFFITTNVTFSGMGGGQSPFSMGKNKARRQTSDVRFSNVAGINEEKAELIELVDYLKNPAKYAEAGARAPKGVLMEGPPGTGKTLLAKAVAGEAGVSFFSISGSEFEEMFVGVGASRVREMFNDAKKSAPAIIFIDEIDAVGRKRSQGIGTGTNEQTLNQLLVEMDGFGTNSGIIVMAATNRADVLDPALLRPGRFDRIIQVSLPDIKERTAILELHAKGFSGAQLENILNEAAILMVREGKKIITITEIDEAIDRVVGGPAKKSRVMTKQDKDIVSYHESGHALIGLKLEQASKVQKVTIIPRGNAGGYTIMTPKDETVFSSKKDLYAMIAGYMGGRAAEEIKFGKDNITTGAHDDLDKATNIARRMVVQFGMSETLGKTKFLTMAEEAYGKIEGTYSQETAAKIDLEIAKILDDAYVIAVKLIKANMKTLELLAESLRVLETITAEQIEYINKNKKLPPEVISEKAKYEKTEKKKAAGEILEID